MHAAKTLTHKKTIRLSYNEVNVLSRTSMSSWSLLWLTGFP